MAALHSPLMSPVMASMGHVSTGQADFVSPSTRRRPNITTPCSVIQPQQLAEQNDANERKERRRSRLLEMQRRNLGSPATPTDKRKSFTTPSAGLTNAQLSEHYANCIKLSAENKINAKNAFGLHLIDYLSELLKKKEMNNFQVASSTLDASAKIYAGRVDAIHSETYKVLTGLGRSSDRRDNEGDGNEEGEVDGEELEGENREAQKNKKRRRKKATVETNLKNINVKKVDMEFEVDPLFQKTSATFDEGGSGGLLLNHLSCLDDSSAIAVDLNTAVASEADALAAQRKPVNPTELRELYGGMSLDPLRICPEFSDFSFTNWSRDGDESFTKLSSTVSKETDRRFDMDAEVEQVTMDHDDGDNEPDLPMDDFTGNDDEEDAPQQDATIIDRLACGSTGITMGNSKEAQLVESAMSDLTHGSVSSLMSVLASEPSEYSYFSTNILQSWAGPEHWKLKPKSKEEKIADKSSEKKDGKKTRKRKEPFFLTEETADKTVIDKAFKETRAATTLTMRTLTKNSKMRTTLPEDLQYDAQDLLRLATKPKVMVKLTDACTDEVDDDGVENYDYSNDNDKENFVPDLPCNDDDPADDGDMGGNTMEFDFSAGDVFSQSQEPGSSQASQGDELNTTVFKGDNFLQQPHKVAKIDIAYAKTAKKVDVKRLKHSIWRLLCTENKKKPQSQEEDPPEEAPKDKEPEENTNAKDGSGDNNKKVAGEHTFTELVNDLPKMVSKNMVKNLSVPIAFVCLLHLANEKTLKIESDADMADLWITQGLNQLLGV